MEELRIAKIRYRILATIADTIINIIAVAIILLATNSISIVTLFFGNTSIINLAILLKLLVVVVIIATYLVVYFTIVPLYTKGQTVGYWLFKIRIVQMDGKNVSFTSLFVRSMLGEIILDVMTLGFGFVLSLILMFYRKDHQALHDVLAKTVVVDA